MRDVARVFVGRRRVGRRHRRVVDLRHRHADVAGGAGRPGRR